MLAQACCASSALLRSSVVCDFRLFVLCSSLLRGKLQLKNEESLALAFE